MHILQVRVLYFFAFFVVFRQGVEYCHYSYCMLQDNEPGPFPTFNHCSPRELVLHAKLEHNSLWGKLRRYEAKITPV